jgi:hypothetical protein
LEDNLIVSRELYIDGEMESNHRREIVERVVTLFDNAENFERNYPVEPMTKIIELEPYLALELLSEAEEKGIDRDAYAKGVADALSTVSEIGRSKNKLMSEYESTNAHLIPLHKQLGRLCMRALPRRHAN